MTDVTATSKQYEPFFLEACSGPSAHQDWMKFLIWGGSPPDKEADDFFSHLAEYLTGAVDKFVKHLKDSNTPDVQREVLEFHDLLERIYQRATLYLNHTNRKLTQGRNTALKRLREKIMELDLHTPRASKLHGMIPVSFPAAFKNRVAPSSSVTDTQVMEQQVMGAIKHVLDWAPGSQKSFTSALDEVFPSKATGEGLQVDLIPVRRTMGYTPPLAINGSSITTCSANSQGGTDRGADGQLSAWQANLRRQATVIAADAAQVLKGLTPFVTKAEPEQVEELRSLINVEIQDLLDEFGRAGEPRAPLVSALFESLWKHTVDFGHYAFLENVEHTATIADETQVAGFDLLKKYVHTLHDTWNKYCDSGGKPFSPSQQVERVNLSLSLISQAASELEAEVDALGLSKQESYPPGLTLHEVFDWIQSLVNRGNQLLTLSGQFGLELLTEQGDKLFWEIANYFHSNKLLADKQVNPVCYSLLSHLDELAGLTLPRSGPIMRDHVTPVCVETEAASAAAPKSKAVQPKSAAIG